MMSAILGKKQPATTTREQRKQAMPVKTSYKSKEVAIPDDFLRDERHTGDSISYKVINFKETDLPQYEPCYAAVLDNVLTPAECDTLLRLAESSVRDEDMGEDGSPWRPALVNAGGGREVLETSYRNSDRIIWDCQDVVDRLWARIAQVPGVMDKLGSVTGEELLGVTAKPDKPSTWWDFHGVNRRMRYLKYGGGQFFAPHCDGAYSTEEEDGTVFRTHYTVHIYLNDSKAEVGDGDKGRTALEGGATTFFSSDEKRRLNVHPKAGRVLIFQHRRLYHSGDNVLAGTKYTIRTDLLYKLRKDGNKVD
ncbi:oxidoreductase domain-containing protein [Apiospora phragmitis]|uniref:Oxidoreductase domain-containing protein n=1 Tax=Apiospora phragmitis TaxID=2905665 RepID=A0ABR1VQL1_9PEZI